MSQKSGLFAHSRFLGLASIFVKARALLFVVFTQLFQEDIDYSSNDTCESSNALIDSLLEFSRLTDNVDDVCPFFKEHKKIVSSRFPLLQLQLECDDRTCERKTADMTRGKSFGLLLFERDLFTVLDRKENRTHQRIGFTFGGDSEKAEGLSREVATAFRWGFYFDRNWMSWVRFFSFFPLKNWWTFVCVCVFVWFSKIFKCCHFFFWIGKTFLFIFFLVAFLKSKKIPRSLEKLAFDAVQSGHLELRHKEEMVHWLASSPKVTGELSVSLLVRLALILFQKNWTSDLPNQLAELQRYVAALQSIRTASEQLRHAEEFDFGRLWMNPWCGKVTSPSTNSS